MISTRLGCHEWKLPETFCFFSLVGELMLAAVALSPLFV